MSSFRHPFQVVLVIFAEGVRREQERASGQKTETDVSLFETWFSASGPPQNYSPKKSRSAYTLWFSSRIISSKSGYGSN
jgi:hypothetical protein